MTGKDLDFVDVYDRRLTQEESIGLALCKDKIESLIAKGAIREAQGARIMVKIMWQAITAEPYINTGHGGL
jgi:hypothetical protein